MKNKSLSVSGLLALSCLVVGCSHGKFDTASTVDAYAIGREGAKARTAAWAENKSGAVLCPESIVEGTDLVLSVTYDTTAFNMPFGVFDGIGKIAGTTGSGTHLATITVPAASLPKGSVSGVLYTENIRDRTASVRQYVNVTVLPKKASGAASKALLVSSENADLRLELTREIDPSQNTGIVNLIVTSKSSAAVQPAISFIPTLSNAPLPLAPTNALNQNDSFQAKVILSQADIDQIKSSGGLTVRATTPGSGGGAPRIFDEVIPLKEISKPKVALNVLPAGTVEKEFGRNFADMFYVCDLAIVNEDTVNGLLVYGSSLSQLVRFSLSRKDMKTQLGSTSAADLAAGNASGFTTFTEMRRPMAFSDILAIFTHDRKANGKQQTIDWMKSAGTLATGLELVLTGSGYAQGVSIFTGILTPELEKRLLWDVLLHLDNLQARSLKEVEEVPAGGQLHRVVFFPKYALQGMMPGTDVYISEIKSGTAEVTVAKIAKLAVIKSTSN